MEIALIGDEDTVLGFKLVGVRHAAVFNESTLKESLKEFKEAKILIITEKVAAYMREQKLMKKVEAAIAEIPDKTGSTGHALKEISRLFENAIGVKMKDK